MLGKLFSYTEQLYGKRIFAQTRQLRQVLYRVFVIIPADEQHSRTAVKPGKKPVYRVGKSVRIRLLSRDYLRKLVVKRDGGRGPFCAVLYLNRWCEMLRTVSYT